MSSASGRAPELGRRGRPRLASPAPPGPSTSPSAAVGGVRDGAAPMNAPNLRKRANRPVNLRQPQPPRVRGGVCAGQDRAAGPGATRVTAWWADGGEEAGPRIHRQSGPVGATAGASVTSAERTRRRGPRRIVPSPEAAGPWRPAGGGRPVAAGPCRPARGGPAWIRRAVDTRITRPLWSAVK